MKHIVHNIRKTINQEREFAVDESMIHWRGRLVFRQYIINLRHKYDIELYLLVIKYRDILNTIIYTENGLSYADNVVKLLMKHFLLRKNLLGVHGQLL